MKPSTGNLAEETAGKLKHIAGICERAGLANVAEDLYRLAGRWREQLRYDRPVIIVNQPAEPEKP